VWSSLSLVLALVLCWALSVVVYFAVQEWSRTNSTDNRAHHEQCRKPLTTQTESTRQKVSRSKHGGATNARCSRKADNGALPRRPVALALALVALKAQWREVDLATPDFSIQVHDVALLRIRALGRDSVMPSECRPCCVFDPLEPRELARLRFEARRLADVLGFAPPQLVPVAPVDTLGLCADPGRDFFGQEVGADLLGNLAKLVAKGGSTGLVETTDTVGSVVCLFTQRVLPADKASGWTTSGVVPVGMLG
jgi:hypothetical protein